MTYEAISQFSKLFGVILFALFFAGVIIYVLLPENREGFEEAAELPLMADDEPIV